MSLEEFLTKDDSRTHCRRFVQSIMSIGKIKEAVLDEVSSIIFEECKSLSKMKSDDGESILRKTSAADLKDFDLKIFSEELVEKAQTFLRILTCSATSERRFVREGPDKKDSRLFVPSAGAVLLKARDDHMSAFQSTISLCLYRGGASKQTIKRLSSLGFCSSHTTLIRKLEDIACYYDSEIKLWKKGVEDYLQQNASSTVNTQRPTTEYQIVGDNLDLEIKPQITTKSHHRRLVHWFNSMAIQHRVLGHHLDDDSA